MLRAHTPALWRGWCATCRCWFPMRTADTNEIRLHCPVCGEEPARLDSRAPSSDVHPDVVRTTVDAPVDTPAECWLG